MHFTMGGNEIYNEVEMQVGGIIFNISRFSVNDRIQTEWSLLVDMIRPYRVRQFQLCRWIFCLIRDILYKQTLSFEEIIDSLSGTAQFILLNIEMCQRTAQEQRSQSALNKINPFTIKPVFSEPKKVILLHMWNTGHHYCVVGRLLSYLGMNLLVFLQDMPVTERGCAR